MCINVCEDSIFKFLILNMDIFCCKQKSKALIIERIRLVVNFNAFQCTVSEPDIALK